MLSGGRSRLPLNHRCFQVGSGVTPPRDTDTEPCCSGRGGERSRCRLARNQGTKQQATPVHQYLKAWSISCSIYSSRNRPNPVEQPKQTQPSRRYNPRRPYLYLSTEPRVSGLFSHLRHPYSGEEYPASRGARGGKPGIEPGELLQSIGPWTDYCCE